MLVTCTLMRQTSRLPLTIFLHLQCRGKEMTMTARALGVIADIWEEALVRVPNSGAWTILQPIAKAAWAKWMASQFRD